MVSRWPCLLIDRPPYQALTELYPVTGMAHTVVPTVAVALKVAVCLCMKKGGVGKRRLGWGMRASPSSPTLNVGISIPGKREKSLPGSPLRRIARAELQNEKSVQRKKHRVERISAGWRGHPNALWVPNQQPCGAEIMRRRSGPIPARGVSGLMGGRLQP